MTENEAFLQAIIANPDDDHLRLIYADWLEERGDPRGEFIRVQIARAGLELGSRERIDLLDREQQLLATHQAAWLGPLHGLLHSWEFFRGFVEKAAVKVNVFANEASDLFRLTPLRHIRFVHCGNNSGPLDRLTQSPYLGRLRGIHFETVHVDDRIVEMLMGNTHLGQVQELSLVATTIGTGSVRAVTNSRHLAKLSRLDLSWNYIGDLALQMLSNTPHLPALNHLHLIHCEISTEGIRTLARSRLLEQLETLDLDENRIENTGVRLLGAARNASSLVALSLRNTGINSLGVEAIAKSPHLGQLRKLDLSRNHISDRGAFALANASFKNMTELVLANCHISPEGQERLKQRFGARVHFSA